MTDCDAALELKDRVPDTPFFFSCSSVTALGSSASPALFVEDTQTDLYVAIDRAADRMGRALDRHLARLRAEGWATEPELAATDARVARELDEALARCLEEPFPDPGTALTGVYADPAAAPLEWYRRIAEPPRG